MWTTGARYENVVPSKHGGAMLASGSGQASLPEVDEQESRRAGEQESRRGSGLVAESAGWKPNE